VLFDSGAMVPVNTAALLPAQNEHTTALLNATFIQFFSPKFGIALGKFNTLEAGALEFYGDYRTQFLNSAFVSPMTSEQVPLSAYGAGAIVLPTPDLSMSLLLMDPNGTPTSNSLSDAFHDGMMVLGSGELTVRPHGLLGHQDLGFAWSNKERYSLDQDPTNLARYLLQTEFPRLGKAGPVLEEIIERYFPGLLDPDAALATKGSSWSLSYGFDQYLWQPAGDDKHGVGVFLSLGASDGNPNPVKYALLAGIGGKGVAGRRDDSYGVGIARTKISSAFLPFLTQRLGLGLDHEDALEMYYNLAVTGWLSLSADLQVIDPGLKKTLNTTTLALENVDTTVIAGVRFRIRF
jgi:porin